MFKKTRDGAVIVGLLYCTYISVKSFDDVLHMIAEQLGVSEHPDFQ